MNFADLNMCYRGSRAQWHKTSGRDRDHFMALIRKYLPRPAPQAAAHKNKPRHADPCTCYQAREAKRDSEGEENRPRRTRRHLDRLSWALLRIPHYGHDSPSDEVHNRKHHRPHGIYEVPIKRNCTKAFTLPRIDPAAQREDQCGT